MAGLVRIASTLGVGLVSTALAVACSGAYASPDIAPDGGAATEPPLREGGVWPVDGTTSDVGRADDAGARTDACGRCDCDDDGFPLAGCLEAGAPDGGFDCDDTDPRTRPAQVFLDVPPASPDGGDWNCSGAVEKAYKFDVVCEGFAMGNCTGKEGFEGNPGCGQEGKYIYCHVEGIISCAVDTTRTVARKQGCK